MNSTMRIIEIFTFIFLAAIVCARGDSAIQVIEKARSVLLD